MFGSFGNNGKGKYNPELSFVVVRRLWTVLLAIGLIIFAHMPPVYAHYVLYFLNGSHFSFLIVITSPACMVDHRAFISHTDVH